MKKMMMISMAPPPATLVAATTTAAPTSLLLLPSGETRSSNHRCYHQKTCSLQTKSHAISSLTTDSHGLPSQKSNHFHPWRIHRQYQRSSNRFMCNSGDESSSSNNDDSESSSSSSSSNSSLTSKSRRDMLLEYVNTVKPEFMEVFAKKAPPQVVDAMRQTVTNMLGTLPSQFFAITVSTVAENLAQLMYSVMMTGYMFRNAQFRLELQQSLAQAALPSISSVKEDPNYAPGVQKKISGEVIRWHNQNGSESMDASVYVELLENEITQLQEQLERSKKVANGGNELLNYLKTLEPQNLQELTTIAGEDALEAMNTFIQRLVGISDPVQLKKAITQTTSTDLAKLLYWLMVVGYSIRNIEVKHDMEKVLGMPIKLAELPPGENV